MQILWLLFTCDNGYHLIQLSHSFCFIHCIKHLLKFCIHSKMNMRTACKIWFWALNHQTIEVWSVYICSKHQKIHFCATKLKSFADLVWIQCAPMGEILTLGSAPCNVLAVSNTLRTSGVDASEVHGLLWFLSASSMDIFSAKLVYKMKFSRNEKTRICS